MAERSGLTVESEPVAFEFHHTVTRFRIRLLCVIAEYRGGASKLPANYPLGDAGPVRPICPLDARPKVRSAVGRVNRKAKSDQ